MPSPELRLISPPASALLPLEARSLTYGLGAREGRRGLVDGLDLRIESRGITAIMGPNGAGKSLLLRLLHGLLTPDGGEVRCAGRPLDAGLRRRQAMVFQNPVLLRRSVAANLDFVLGRGNRERRDQLLESAGLSHRAKAPARRLSGGEAQRLALVRALAMAPEMLFLDEPTASLDPAAILAFEGLMREAAAQGTKLVLVTHDTGQAKRLAEDVAFVHEGRAIEHAPASIFLARPATAAARAYLEGRLPELAGDAE